MKVIKFPLRQQLRIKKHKHCCRINKKRNEAALAAAFLVQQTHFLNCLKNVPYWYKAYTPQLRALFCQAAKAAKAAPPEPLQFSTHTI